MRDNGHYVGDPVSGFGLLFENGVALDSFFAFVEEHGSLDMRGADAVNLYEDWKYERERKIENKGYNPEEYIR